MYFFGILEILCFIILNLKSVFSAVLGTPSSHAIPVIVPCTLLSHVFITPFPHKPPLHALIARLPCTPSTYTCIPRLHRTPSTHAIIARLHRTPSSHAFLAIFISCNLKLKPINFRQLKNMCVSPLLLGNPRKSTLVTCRQTFMVEAASTDSSCSAT